MRSYACCVGFTVAPIFFCVILLKIKNVKMTKKLLSSSNPDHALNGSTLVLDVKEQLSYIVQESNIFITSHLSDVASETDQGFGSIEDCKGMHLKGQQTAYISSKAPVKSVPASTTRMCSSEASWHSFLAWDWQGLLWLSSHTVVYIWLDKLHVEGFKYGKLLSRYFEIYSMDIHDEELLEEREVYIKPGFLWLISRRS